MSKKNVLGMIKGNVTIINENSHPAESMDIEGKNHYLNALAVLAAIDDDLSPAKKAFLKKIIAQLNLTEEKIEELIEIANDPSEEIISEFMNYFQKSELIYHLLIDCFTLAELDGEAGESVSEMIEHICRNSGIKGNEKEFLKKLPEIMRTENIEKAFNLLLDDQDLLNKFKPILKLYGLDIQKYHEELKKILDFETETWTWKKDVNVRLKLDFLPSCSNVNNMQFQKFLNYLRVVRNIEVEPEEKMNEFSKVIIRNGTESILCYIDVRDIKYLDDFCVKDGKEIQPFLGITPEGAYIYSNFATKVLEEETCFTEFELINKNAARTEDFPMQFSNFEYDEIFQFNNHYFYLNKYTSSYTYGYGFEKIADEQRNLAFRLMKKVDGDKSKTENKDKKNKNR